MTALLEGKAEAHITEAWVDNRLGRNEEAWAALEAAPPQHNNRTRMLLLLRALTAQRLGKSERARRSLQEVISLIEEALATIANADGNVWWYLNLMHRLLLEEAQLQDQLPPEETAAGLG